VVGVLLPTTGAAASYGESMKHGIDLAVKQASADGSLSGSVRWVWGDSGSDPAKAVAELKRLAGEGAHIVIAGTTSDEAKAYLPSLDKLNILALSPSASAPDLTKSSRNFFRVFASDELEGRRAGRFLREEQDADTVLIYAEDTEQARGIEPPFRQVFEQAMEGRSSAGLPGDPAGSSSRLTCSQPTTRMRCTSSAMPSRRCECSATSASARSPAASA
jgi:branched-chain amino acid transport system substrate-binding protein